MNSENPIPDDLMNWLLEEKDPGARYLTIRDLLGQDKENQDLKQARRLAHQEGPISKILNKMQSDGYWAKPGAGYAPKYKGTVWALILLAQLGASVHEDQRIQLACEYLLEHSLTQNGQFTIRGTPSTTIDCLQGNLCWALTSLGYDHPRMDAAFEWMARSVTGEGVAPKEDKKAELRYYAYQCGPTFACGPNMKLPCAWGAAKVMLAFAILPPEKQTPLIKDAIEHGVEFLFSVDPASGDYPAGMTGKPSGNWWKFGFPVFYVTDILQIAEALVGLGYRDDPRLANTINLIESKQDESDRWLLEYDYTGKTWQSYGKKKAPNKWVTIRALRVLGAK